MEDNYKFPEEQQGSNHVGTRFHDKPHKVFLEGIEVSSDCFEAIKFEDGFGWVELFAKPHEIHGKEFCTELKYGRVGICPIQQ